MRSKVIEAMVLALILLALLVAVNPAGASIREDGYQEITGEWYDYEARLLAVPAFGYWWNLRCDNGALAVTLLGNPVDTYVFYVPDGIESFRCRWMEG